MGYISNQWLNRGEGVRNRRYTPKRVTVNGFVPSDDWSMRKEVRAEFTAKKEDGQFQTMHLSQAEVDEAAMVLLRAMSTAARERLLIDSLQKLSHSKLLRLLAFDLRQRVRLPK